MVVYDDASSTSASIASMKKWGIPVDQTPELTLLERLVWVEYTGHWWPALLYDSYIELQKHLYSQLDMVLKAQFAMAIMRQLQEPNPFKVARLLGRHSLEIVEVNDLAFHEFYLHLPTVLPQACRRSNYEEDQLYLDFHRALDQVEEIIHEVSSQSFAIAPVTDQRSWLERAQAKVRKASDDSSSMVSSVELNRTLKSKHSKNTSAIKRSASLESQSNSTIATNEVSILTSTQNGPSSTNGIEIRLHEPARQTLDDYRQEGTYSLRGSKLWDDLSMGSSKISRSSRDSSRKRQPRSFLESIPSMTSNKSEDDFVSQRSEKSKRSLARTERVDNRKESRNPAERVDERDPHPTAQPLYDLNFERTAPTLDDVSNQTRRLYNRKKQISPINILPGLEGDDIFPGLSMQVHSARESLQGVLRILTGAKITPLLRNSEEPILHTENSMEAPHLAGSALPRFQEEPVPTSTADEFVRALSAEGTPQEEAVRILERQRENIGFWQRFTCYTGE